MKQLDLFGKDTGICVFCRMVSGEAGGHVLFEDEISIAFLDNKPLFLGHTLLIPKQHYQTLGDLPDDLTPRLFLNAKLLMRAVEKAMKADGTFIAINNRVSQSVPHLHIHVIPRRKGDGLKGFFWPRKKYPDAKSMKDTQNLIRLAIKETSTD